MTDIDFEVDDRPWPAPEPCPYCESDSEAVKAEFCKPTCPGCLTRHFDDAAPAPVPWWRRLWDLVALERVGL